MKCDFCGGTGFHLSPDVVEPILIPCTKKGCKAGKKPPKPPKKTTTMSGVKYEWVVIEWHGPAGWEVVSKKTGDFKEHMAQVAERRKNSPPGHVKSIHVCWLDDVRNWDGPEDVVLSLHDRLEVKHFKKFLELKEKYGMEVLEKRPYWRKYLGLED